MCNSTEGGGGKQAELSIAKLKAFCSSIPESLCKACQWGFLW